MNNRAKLKNVSVQNQGKENVMQATPDKKADKKDEPIQARQDVKEPENKSSPKKPGQLYEWFHPRCVLSEFSSSYMSGSISMAICVL